MNNLVFKNGVRFFPADTPAVSTFLQSNPGAYTTTRTHKNGVEILFWERHIRRLTDSVNILLRSKPELLFNSQMGILPFDQFLGKSALWDSVVDALVNDSMRKALPDVSKEMKCRDEIAITTLVSGSLENLEEVEFLDEGRISGILDIYLHFSCYVPLAFGSQGSGARLAVVGRGRDIANAKYSDWVRHRKHLDKLRPPSITELLLSNDGNHILEGCVTNFFVVYRKEDIEESVDNQQKGLAFEFPVEIQTAPLGDGVLPGVIRQVILDICSKNGITFREVSPSWEQRENWEEAFITNGLRLIQHVETILAPNSWELLESKSWTDVAWEEKLFQEGPGRITSLIKKELMVRAAFEAHPVATFDDR